MAGASIPGKDNKFVFIPQRPNRLGLIKPPIQWVPAAVFLGLQRPDREDNHSHLSSADAKNGGTIRHLAHIPSWHDA
jgi:hypothetical protein